MGLGKSCVVRFTIPSQLLQGFWECSWECTWWGGEEGGCDSILAPRPLILFSCRDKQAAHVSIVLLQSGVDGVNLLSSFITGPLSPHTAWVHWVLPWGLATGHMLQQNSSAMDRL